MYSEDGEPLRCCDYLFPHVSPTEFINWEQLLCLSWAQYSQFLAQCLILGGARVFLKECVKRPVGVWNVNSWKIQWAIITAFSNIFLLKGNQRSSWAYTDVGKIKISIPFPVSFYHELAEIKEKQYGKLKIWLLNELNLLSYPCS